MGPTSHLWTAYFSEGVEELGRGAAYCYCSVPFYKNSNKSELQLCTSIESFFGNIQLPSISVEASKTNDIRFIGIG